MTEESIAAIDEQEHVDSIYAGAEVLRLEAGYFLDSHVDQANGTITDEVWAEDHLRMTQAASNLEVAAEAFIELQTARDALSAAAHDLIETIDLHTDCMDGRIDREALDPWIEKLQALLVQK